MAFALLMNFSMCFYQPQPHEQTGYLLAPGASAALLILRLSGSRGAAIEVIYAFFFILFVGLFDLELL